ncbi:nascent polypeptide-associated complex protein [Candidatus Woesearchaeota archaeon]|nr:nascent polypeptide-associated complex protein [Candidatus Woesearchaeota archaeon]
MIPGMDPRAMKQAMKRLGIQEQEVDATEVIIRLADKDIVIASPKVSKVNMMGQITWQIMGNAEERKKEISIDDDDVQTVMQQANASEEEARAALEEAQGDIAGAILQIQQHQ